ncbi:hypothetical protein [Muricoccus vinaceus]|uniref:Uncharacterized protein n=1 Tax=Muricoccus vinaceus TaxID=424704 RepID=A0ABV6J1T1_9PROT
MSDRPSKEEEELRRLEEALIEDILAASDEDILAEAEEDGIDPAANQAEMLQLVEAAELVVGKARMAAARAAAAAAREAAPPPKAFRAGVPGAGPLHAANDIDANRELTLAARNGGDQSARDQDGIDEDIAELEALQGKSRDPEV